MIKRPTKDEGNNAFCKMVDSNLRRGVPVSRTLFKTVWGGRQHLENGNHTVPHGWGQ
jgi:hypothetical protein